MSRSKRSFASRVGWSSLLGFGRRVASACLGAWARRPQRGALAARVFLPVCELCEKEMGGRPRLRAPCPGSRPGQTLALPVCIVLRAGRRAWSSASSPVDCSRRTCHAMAFEPEVRGAAPRAAISPVRLLPTAAATAPVHRCGSSACAAQPHHGGYSQRVRVRGLTRAPLRPAAFSFLPRLRPRLLMVATLGGTLSPSLSAARPLLKTLV